MYMSVGLVWPLSLLSFSVFLVVWEFSEFWWQIEVVRIIFLPLLVIYTQSWGYTWVYVMNDKISIEYGDLQDVFLRGGSSFWCAT